MDYRLFYDVMDEFGALGLAVKLQRSGAGGAWVALAYSAGRGGGLVAKSASPTVRDAVLTLLGQCRWAQGQDALAELSASRAKLRAIGELVADDAAGLVVVVPRRPGCRSAFCGVERSCLACQVANIIGGGS